jgi:Uma2 family endonuclease
MATALLLPQPRSHEIQIRLTPSFTDREFVEICRLNSDWRFERTAEGEIIVMPPAYTKTGAQNAELSGQLRNWAKQDGTGIALDSSAGFRLPSGAIRAPDASWLRTSRLKKLRAVQRKGFLPLCPDFVVELLSASDSLSVAKAKMEEYLANGAKLGWLLDPKRRHVYVYHPGKPVRRLDAPERVSGDPLLPGFTLDLRDIWNPGL